MGFQSKRLIQGLLPAIIIAGLVFTSCSTMGAPMTIVNNQDAPLGWVLITPDPNARATPTPFLPSARTPIPTQPPTPTPTPDPYIDWPEAQDQIVFLILGSDYRPASGFRTDIILLVGVNPQNNQVSVISFPRDLCVYIPGTYSGYSLEACDRINTAMQHGFETTANMFETNFGIRPDYYAMTNFQGFVSLVNELGGIDVYAGRRFSDECTHSTRIGDYCYINQGKNYMDGDLALWYVRSRYSTSDYDRGRRAQEVLSALFDRMMTLNFLTKIPAMFEIYDEYVDTNIPLEVILSLAKTAASIDLDEDVYHETIAPPMVYDAVKSNGAMVSLPNHYLIAPVIQRAFYGQ
jgi:LCP family protein required for cell wall assembly